MIYAIHLPRTSSHKKKFRLEYVTLPGVIVLFCSSSPSEQSLSPSQTHPWLMHSPSLHVKPPHGAETKPWVKYLVGQKNVSWCSIQKYQAKAPTYCIVFGSVLEEILFETILLFKKHDMLMQSLHDKNSFSHWQWLRTNKTLQVNDGLGQRACPRLGKWSVWSFTNRECS